MVANTKYLPNTGINNLIAVVPEGHTIPDGGCQVGRPLGQAQGSALQEGEIAVATPGGRLPWSSTLITETHSAEPGQCAIVRRVPSLASSRLYQGAGSAIPVPP